ncbi:MAG: DUF559 domain-containing protein [Candidatus Latescibacteria bacterium]|nr:DUF559 domain-containing protein [Candidatus Latescibacterota bacterium]
MKNLIRETIRSLRNNSTQAENIFWERVRNRKIHGCKFLRQHPIRFEIDGKRRFFVADFYCADYKIVVEIDGAIHNRQKDYDKLRTYIIENKGLRVIRFKNDDVEHDIDGIIDILTKALT